MASQLIAKKHDHYVSLSPSQSKFKSLAFFDVAYIGFIFAELFSYLFLLFTVSIINILLYYIVILCSFKGGPSQTS